MKNQTIIWSDNERISLSKDSDCEEFKLHNDESGQDMYLTEEELRQLATMIENILQHVHKQDW